MSTNVPNSDFDFDVEKVAREECGNDYYMDDADSSTNSTDGRAILIAGAISVILFIAGGIGGTIMFFK